MKKINIKGIISLIPPWVLLLIVDILIGYFIVDMTYLYTVYSTIKKILFTIFILLPISICTLFLILLTYILFVVWFKEKIKGWDGIAQLFSFIIHFIWWKNYLISTCISLIFKYTVVSFAWDSRWFLVQKCNKTVNPTEVILFFSTKINYQIFVDI